ncbi:UDP-D-galactose:(glucosyl)lipopolysaccharide-1, 6-D-galactosyltransferase [Pseudomonas sp. SCT]|uniref:FkbM family methyltransferase n=1 Tax=Pseudomonas sp. (strain SCT) TaxID=412955 RepID=UPI000EC0A433|nr:FkbM family methyltransferase [Pseudomonas sp. SCT]GCA55487.1 UDP-D-galactose:(glucosyl)lipopolysaccharide-1, 6-D-galactosyltransferase [Pseudomonas sp. SCT]
MFISYAQNFEDVILWRALKDVPNGTYVDVGANDPDVDSVTKAFYLNGWRGVNIEPVKNYFDMLVSKRENDINVNVAASSVSGQITLYEIEDTGLSTSVAEIAERHTAELGIVCVERTAMARTLTEIVLDASIDEIHFLKIDVEGHEKDVLLGLDLNKIRPWIILVEATAPATQLETYGEWEYLILSAGYIFAYYDGLNRFYVAEEHSDRLNLIATPPNVFDGFIRSREAQLLDELSYFKGLYRDCCDELEGCRNQLKLEKQNGARLESLIESYESSMSWFITRPLRRFNPFWALRASIGKGALLINRYEPIGRPVKGLLKKYPVLWAAAKRYLLFATDSVGVAASTDQYAQLSFDGICMQFALGPLSDRRGIGRVSKALFDSLSAMQTAPQEFQETVFFYSSIHWCPTTLPLKSIVYIHDVIPLLYPELYPVEILRDWNYHYSKVASQASIVVTISESSAADIVRLLNVPTDKVIVVPNGVSVLPTASNIAPPSDKYFVYVGSYDVHKNLQVVLNALTSPRLTDVHLALIGDNHKALAVAKSLNIDSRIHCYGRLEDADMGRLIQNSIGLVFPSLYEGFGLPPLEAAKLGRPSICSRRPAMTEFLEGAALFADAEDIDEWTDRLVQLAEDEDLAVDVGQAAKRKADSMTWNKSAELLLHALRTIVK